MKIMIIFVIFLATSIYVFGVDKSQDTTNDSISIVQTGNTKFVYSKNNKYLNNHREILNSISSNDIALKMYKDAYNGYVGSSVMSGFGISLSILSTPFLLSGIVCFALYQNLEPSYFGLTIGAGLSFIGSLVLWIEGAYHKGYYRVKENEAIKYYNESLKGVSIKINDKPFYIDVNAGIDNNYKINKVNILFSFSL
jgi:hypothetical protein